MHFTSVSKCQSCVIDVNVLPDGWRLNIDVQLSQAGSFVTNKYSEIKSQVVEIQTKLSSMLEHSRNESTSLGLISCWWSETPMLSGHSDASLLSAAWQGAGVKGHQHTLYTYTQTESALLTFYSFENNNIWDTNKCQNYEIYLSTYIKAVQFTWKY